MQIDIRFFGLIWCLTNSLIQSLSNFINIWYSEIDTTILRYHIVKFVYFLAFEHNFYVFGIGFCILLCEEAHEEGVTAENSITKSITYEIL